jgi:phosphoribosylformylglycinamidine (FGAM) synthase PurS component
MKAKIEVVLKKGVFDPQGHTIMQALHHLNYRMCPMSRPVRYSISTWTRPIRTR